MRFFSNDKDARDDQQGVDVRERAEDVNPDQAHDDHPERVQSDPVAVPEQRSGSPWSSTPDTGDGLGRRDDSEPRDDSERRDDSELRDDSPFGTIRFRTMTGSGRLGSRHDSTTQRARRRHEPSAVPRLGRRHRLLADRLARRRRPAAGRQRGAARRRRPGAVGFLDHRDVRGRDRKSPGGPRPAGGSRAGRQGQPDRRRRETVREDTTPPDHAVSDTAPDATVDGGSTTTTYGPDGTVTTTDSSDTSDESTDRATPPLTTPRLRTPR